MAHTVNQLASALSISSSATLAITATAAIGDLLVLAVVSDNAGASGVASLSTTVTDSAGNTWTNRGGIINQTAGAANDGTSLGLWTTVVTSPLVAGTITVNFSPSTVSKAAVVFQYVPEGVATFETVGPGATGNGASWSITATGVLNSHTIFAFSAQEGQNQGTADSDTTNGSWSARYHALADTGSATSSQSITGQFKTVNATGDQTYNSGSGAGARDFAINWLTVYEVVEGALSAPMAADAAAFSMWSDSEIVLAATMAPDVAAFAAVHPVEAAFAVTMAPDVAAFVGDGIHYATLASTMRPDRAAFLILPVWPETLPRPELAGYSLAPAAAVRRTPVEFGPARVYRTGKRPLAEVAVTWHLDGEQQMWLDDFYREAAQEGGQWFLVELAFPASEELSTVSARFRDQLTMQPIGGDMWQASGTLEVQERPSMSDAALTALLDDEGDEPAWPEDLLPRPLLDSWTLAPKPVVARSEDLPGFPRQRRRSRNAVTDVTTQWRLDPTQAAIFDAFFRWRGKDGARWFGFPIAGGLGFRDGEVRFLGEADWKPTGRGNWSVAAPIEIRDRPIAYGQLDFTRSSNSQYVPLI